MKESVYMFSSGKLKRKNNTIYFENKNGVKKYLPVENVNELYLFGEFELNSKLLNFFSQNEIIIHYFNYYDYYAGSFYPREHYNSGYMIINQAKHYFDVFKRLSIAKAIVIGASKNTLKVLQYYNKRNKNLEEHISKISDKINKIDKVNDINKLMQVEGNIKKIYYDSFNIIINNDKFYFYNRNKRPPNDYINSLISFSNSIIYTKVLSEIYKTHLDPRIGYLHTSNFRRFSLNLDIAEIFKPIIGDRIIFSLINKKVVGENDFEKKMNGIYLNDSGRKKFLVKMEDKLRKTIKYRKMHKNVSYQRLLRLESYKIEKHIMGDQKYIPFVMEW